MRGQSDGHGVHVGEELVGVGVRPGAEGLGEGGRGLGAAAPDADEFGVRVGGEGGAVGVGGPGAGAEESVAHGGQTSPSVWLR